MSTGLIVFFVITSIIGVGVVVFSVDSIGAKIFGTDDKRQK
ncbi:MAG: hypothetical protein SPLUMA2_SPLUMAMAG2_00855 [uncultured Sulfurimonas sp.]|nr:MAG: hypothetical protein SPLUMA1_SPLUMAMAG1_00868 [uncultured Sulfurimonas sp.]CAI6159797.1 MAG: hypothetical protein SPLUMA2_SPLUMAMAG2_00855 [uncultured Sulfurimonas sp.]